MHSRTTSAAPRAPRSFGALLLGLTALCSILLLSGCLLISGGNQSADATADGGNVYVSYVSAEGADTRAIKTNFPNQVVEVTIFARNERGQIRIEILNDQNSVVLAVEGTAQEQIRRGQVQTNADGEFRYRIRATGAQRGAFQILYEPVSS